MDALITASTKVADHVATNRRPLPPAFPSRYSAERYRQDVMDAHVEQARLEPEPPLPANLPAMYTRAARGYEAMLVAMAVLVALACYFH